ncbi:hypothetical protein [Phycicoccus jejuensis]|uniref:hypothetical protein n=1 Tax=Phycicoccus jejuensis TaxID=367299 RepID=UPI0012F88105|nr:hypothetical protein [Phycicoccus jejuensis]
MSDPYATVTTHDPYCDPATGTLLNSFGITDPARLEETETRISMVRDIKIATPAVAGTVRP